MSFRIDLKIFLFAGLLCITKQIQLYVIIMFFCILHEFGHLLAGKLLGMQIEKIMLMPLGFSISFKLNVNDYNKKIGNANKLEIKKIIIALAGPLINLLIFIIVYILSKNGSSILVQNVMYSNLLIFLFNLLPIFPLDGGRVLNSFLYIKFGKRNALYYTNLISNIILIIFLIFSSFSILALKNIAIFLISIFLTVIVIQENRTYQLRKKIYELISKI